MMTLQEQYIRKHKRSHRMIFLARLCIIAVFLLVWEVSANTGLIDPFFFSSPSRVCKSFVTLYQENGLLGHIGITLLETLLSFLLVFGISMLAATLLWYSDKISAVLEPYLVVLNSLPKSALAPLFIVWLGTGIKTIIVAGISVAVFGAIISLYTGFALTEPEKCKLITTLGGSRKQIFNKVVLPSNILLILSTMKVNIGLSLVGVIIGEFLAARRGLGYLIIYGSQTFKMSMVITSIVILCMIAMLLYLILQFAEHWYKKRVL
jgi:ABC-type nitrate/sulfonate/bicarbonate transport system, permease component